VYGSFPDPALGDEEDAEPAGVAVDFFAVAVALGPSAGSLPDAISAEIRTPTARVVATARAAILAVRPLVEGNGWRYLR
jgi:hypothetical protein